MRTVVTSAALVLVVALMASIPARPAVPQGTREGAERYYRALSETLNFKTPGSILASTLDDFLAYVGFGGLRSIDLVRLDSAVLMNPDQLGRPCPADPCPTAVSDPAGFAKAFGAARLKKDEILAARFFAPKIVNVNDAPETRALGWRKLVRLRTRRGSEARKHGIESSVVLLNFFTAPGVPPFGAGATSVNTQVMLLTGRTEFDRGEKDAIYWLDFDQKFGLSPQLDASFDAADLQAGPGGVLPYFVPDGCVACHGENPAKALVNYLDTDHWFDRVPTDFQRLAAEKAPVLFDAGTNDSSKPEFRKAFDVIRQFNKEAAAQVKMAQPQAFHRRASDTWLRLHKSSRDHVPPLQRAIRTSEQWQPEDRTLLEDLNQYCFRCHGTIKFNVFEKAEVHRLSGFLQTRLKPVAAQLAADPHFRMPPDRTLDSTVIERIWTAVGRLEGPGK